MLIWMLLLGSLAVGKAQSKCVDMCGGNMSQRRGVISSPPHTNSDDPRSFWGRTEENIFCTWNIIAPLHHRIRIEFLDFKFPRPLHIRSIPHICEDDYVHITSIRPDGTEEEGEKFCLSSPRNPIISKYERLKIVFKAYPHGTDKKFTARFLVIDNPVTPVPEVSTLATTAVPKDLQSSDSELKKSFESSKYRNIQWLLNQMKKKKSLELPRSILALYLTEPGFYAPGNQTGVELRDRLTIHILAQISRNATIRSQDLSLYVQALLVTCQDPRDFYDRDLVSEIRKRVDKHSAFANPFEILALCNAGDNVSTKDVERVSGAFDSQHRPFWIDVQAMATMAMQCLSTRVTVDDRVIKDMQDELKKRQFRNGSVENLATTALVVQALGHNGSSVEFFDLPSALDVLLKAQGEDGSWGGSVRNSFYVLPAISRKSFLNIDARHCPRNTESEEESLARLQESGGDKRVVQYSVWVGSDVDLGRTWRVRMPSNKNTSFYDLMETVSKLDNRHNVSYQVVDGKPYVRSLLGKEDDPELGIFWFTYVRSTSTNQPPSLVESSPADILLNPNQEFIMWYKPNTWREDSAEEVSKS